MPRGKLHTPGEQARRFTIRLQADDWKLFDNEADELYRDAAEHIQSMVVTQVYQWRAKARERAKAAAARPGVYYDAQGREHEHGDVR